MTKKIVGTFNSDFSKIEFYEVMENYKEYTIIRKQGTEEYYAWNNKHSLLSGNLHIIGISENKNLLKDVISNVQDWYAGMIFFWADSKFVTEYGLPNYDKLINIFQQLINIKRTEFEIMATLEDCRKNGTFLEYIKSKMLANKFMRRQRRTVKEIEKEFKVIW